MYNIKKAVSRLEFAPKSEEIKVTDIKHGLGAFTPKPDKVVSFFALRATLKKAGYTLASADITVDGKLSREAASLWLEADTSKQRFALEGGNDGLLKEIENGARVEVTGDWQTIGEGATAQEVIHPSAANVLGNSKTATTIEIPEQKGDTEPIQVSLNGIELGGGLLLAPVRTTSPGLTVYKGGAITPRYYYIRQHLGGLEVNRQAIRVSVSYTPTPTLQLEAEIPYQRTSFEDGMHSGSGNGLGNIVVWGKYRFYRELETWGDKQAAVRFGFELPTGEKSAPGTDNIVASDFIRQQLSPINGGLALHTDVAFSQAHRRFIYGADVEGTIRGERNGFRMGHEVRLNTDFRDARDRVRYDHLIFTGPIDEYYDHCFGHLPYRSLRFEPETLSQEYFQPAMQVNYPNDYDFTRIVEIKHATGQKLPATTIVREYPENYGPGREPYYPIPAPDAKALYQKYADRAASEKNVTFVGRLATYRYYNMDQVVGMALTEFDRLAGRAQKY